jgi:hypothetical protein
VQENCWAAFSFPETQAPRTFNVISNDTGHDALLALFVRIRAFRKLVR